MGNESRWVPIWYMDEMARMVTLMTLSARAMLHLRDTLPKFFHSDRATSSMFPDEVFSQNIVLKLPAPLPLKVSPRVRAL